MAQTIGSSLVPVRATWARQLSLKLTGIIHQLRLQAVQDGSPKTLYDGAPDCRVFAMTAAPSVATSTSVESPGQDLCFIMDTANTDLYLVYGWSAAATYSCVKILD